MVMISLAFCLTSSVFAIFKYFVGVVFRSIETVTWHSRSNYDCSMIVKLEGFFGKLVTRIENA